MKPKVFISYNHTAETKNSIRQISDELNNMGLKVWLDEQQIKPGDSISEAVQKGLDESSYVVAVVGPNDKKSNWANRELEIAVSKKKRIIPVMVNNAKPEDLPDVISNLMAVDISRDRRNLTRVYEAIDQDKSIWSKLKEYIINE